MNEYTHIKPNWDFKSYFLLSCCFKFVLKRYPGVHAVLFFFDKFCFRVTVQTYET